MKKKFTLWLCLVLCFYFIPFPVSAEGSIQYAAMTAENPEDESTFQLDSATSVSEAVYNPKCIGVVVYSLDAGDVLPEVPDNFDGFEDKTVVLSDVTYTGIGYIGCRDLYLLGGAEMVLGNMVVSGSSTNGTPKPALTEGDLGNYENLQSALEGAGKKYTIVADTHIDYPLSCEDLEINEGVTLTIDAPSEGDGTNGIVVSHSLIVNVNGTLTAEDGQTLEIREGCTTVTGVTLYQDDGAEFTTYGVMPETFEYHTAEDKWIRRPTGDPSGDDPQNTHTLTLDYNSSNGRVLLDRFNGQGPMFEPPGDYSVSEGANVRVQIEPGQGYVIQEVRVDGGDPLIDENTQEPVAFYDFDIITASHNLLVTFVRPEYTMTITHSGNGQIEALNELEGVVDGSTVIYTLQHDENIRFRFIPDNGYMVSEIQADGIDEEPWDEYEFNNVTENHTLHVAFDKKGDGTMHTITITANEGGTVEADGLENGSVQVEDMFDHIFTFTPESGYRLQSVIAAGEGYEMDMTYYGVEYNEDGSCFTLTLEEVYQDMTLDILFGSENAEDITSKKYVVTADNDTPATIAFALAREFGYLVYAVDPADITVENIDLSGIATVGYGYGTFDFSVTVGGDSIEDQGFIVPTHEYIIFEFDGTHGESPVNEIRVLTPEGIDHMEFGVPAMDSGSIRLYGANGIRFEGVLSSDIHDAFIDGTRNESVIGRAFYRAQWHIGNAYDMHEPQGLNLFGLNLIQDNAFCVEVAASDGEDEQKTYNWDLNRYAQLTTGNYTSEVFFGNDTFTLRLPTNGIGGVDSLVIETGDFPGYTISEDTDNQYTLTFLSDFYDNITLTLLINGSAERELTIHRVGVDIQEVEKRPDSDFANVFHGTQNGTHIAFNGQNNYQLFATYYIPDFGDTAPFGLYVTYTWANGTTTTQIITQPEITGNVNTGPDFDGVFRDDGHNNFASCCDYRLYTAPDNSAAPERVNVIVLEGNPLDADAFGGVSLGSGRGVEWTCEE